VVGVVGNFLLDLIDGGAACRGVTKYSEYQRIDKLLDWWWFVFVIVYVYINMNQSFVLLFALFAFRTVGEILFLFSSRQIWLVFFPNFFEFTFMCMFFGIWQSNWWVGMGIFCIMREYVIHIRKFSSRKLLGLPVEWVKE
jgi:hypothetical protein